jgi:hypothetical protein
MGVDGVGVGGGSPSVVGGFPAFAVFFFVGFYNAS